MGERQKLKCEVQVQSPNPNPNSNPNPNHPKQKPNEQESNEIGADIIAPQFGKKRRRQKGNYKRRENGIDVASSVEATVEPSKVEKSETSETTVKKKNWLRRLLD